MNRQSFRITRLAFCVLALAALGACAFGQKVSYSAVKADVEAQGSSTVAVATHDQRPYVVSGDKKPTFVGLRRGGFGNPFDVNTVSGAPLADDFSSSIAASLAARGFKPTVIHLTARESPRALKEALRTPTERVVLVTLREWKSDTFVHTKLIWNVTVAVYDNANRELANVPFQGEEPIGADVQAAFTRKLEEWFSDAKIVAALK